MRAAAPLALALALAFVTGGCGSTRVITNERTARIYVDGRPIGKGSGTFRKRGAPGTAQIVVVAADGRRAVKQVKRKFTGTTLIVGLFTYMIGWVAAWEYPDSVYVELEEPQAPAAVDWGGADDLWMKPPPGWQPPEPEPEPEPVDDGSAAGAEVDAL